jgi:hypothetical protein
LAALQGAVSLTSDPAAAPETALVRLNVADLEET